MKLPIINQKGGVGKSAISINLSYFLSIAGYKTLIIDFDPSYNCSKVFAPLKDKEKTIGKLILNKKNDIMDFIQPAQVAQILKNDEEEILDIKNLYIIPSDMHLATSAEDMVTKYDKQKFLDKHLQAVEKKFEFIIIDCPPTLGVLTVNAIYTGDVFLIPTDYGKDSLDGIEDLFDISKEIRPAKDYDYRIVRSMKDSRNKRTNEAIEGQLEQYGDKLLNTIVRLSQAHNQARMEELPTAIFDPKAPGNDDFNSLKKEILTLWPQKK